MTWSVLLSSAAVRTVDSVPPRVLPAVIGFFYDPLAQDPHRVGKPLRDDLAGLHSARRGSYHVLYEIDDDSLVVTVIRIKHRSSIYRPRPRSKWLSHFDLGLRVEPSIDRGRADCCSAASRPGSYSGTSGVSPLT